MVTTQSTAQFISVYGPVKSWRYGRSLGIDPIGEVSTCSFNCVYCQLGEIEHKTSDRALFIPTQKIIEDLNTFAPWDVDIITLSGSGEPTLALNLGEILQEIKTLTQKPTLVLTNGTLLGDPLVRTDLAYADKVSVKLDGIFPDQLSRINRPVRGLNFSELITGIQEFSRNYPGQLGIQTMILTPWDEVTQERYIHLINQIQPQEIHLNTPKRPKPLKHELEARGNHSNAEDRPYRVQVLKCVDDTVLHQLATRITQDTKIPVRYSI
ncbi:Radical SAM domain protein [Gloeothece citriformis PCC 7424]|uniref:Radical SAM domain protein n=1 Tax=Gloeothece citriformis (strain PCC 7424) TaxID=65393 RepID=B7KJ72_GLOC7|nr:radical SAM protein [Gloeothece citriformis]ACK72156.1 Radical SAM domain protein [Gloeothece citriformis PCC 7424]